MDIAKEPYIVLFGVRGPVLSNLKDFLMMIFTAIVKGQAQAVFPLVKQDFNSANNLLGVTAPARPMCFFRCSERLPVFIPGNLRQRC